MKIPFSVGIRRHAYSRPFQRQRGGSSVRRRSGFQRFGNLGFVQQCFTKGFDTAYPLSSHGLPANHERIYLDPALETVSIRSLQNVGTQCWVVSRVSFLATGAGQSSSQGRPFIRIGMIAVAFRSMIAVWQPRVSQAPFAVTVQSAELCAFRNPVAQCWQQAAFSIAA